MTTTKASRGIEAARILDLLSASNIDTAVTALATGAPADAWKAAHAALSALQALTLTLEAIKDEGARATASLVGSSNDTPIV